MTQSPLRLRDDRVEWRVVEDEIVALTRDGDRYLGANRTGALLWQALAAGTHFEHLTSILVAAGAHTSAASEDAEAFLAALRVRDLLQE